MSTHAKPIVIPSMQGRKYDWSPLESIRFMLSAAETASQFDLVEMEVRSGGGPPLHIHPQQDEIHYVLQGQLQYQVGEEMFELHSGDSIYIPCGTPHAWINLQPEPARIVGFLNPGGGEPFFKTVAESTGEMEPEAIAALAGEHGADVVGPPLAVTLTDLNSWKG